MVKVVVLQVDVSKKRLSLGMKASYFTVGQRLVVLLGLLFCHSTTSVPPHPRLTLVWLTNAGLYRRLPMQTKRSVMMVSWTLPSRMKKSTAARVQGRRVRLQALVLHPARRRRRRR